MLSYLSMTRLEPGWTFTALEGTGQLAVHRQQRRAAQRHYERVTLRLGSVLPVQGVTRRAKETVNRVTGQL